MASRPPPRGLREQEITEILDESEVDLSDEDEPEEFVPLPHDGSCDSDSGSSSSLDIEVESCPDSAISASSSITTSRRNRARTRGGPRTRRGLTRGRVSSRGGREQNLRTLPSEPVIINNWTGDFSPLEQPMLQPRYLVKDTNTWEYEDFFKQYIDDDVLQRMFEATNRTYLQQKGFELRLTLKELKTFIGILLLMGCINLPMIKMYWSNKYGIKIIKTAMTRKRFFSIRASLKVVYDPEVTQQNKINKIWKVAPLFDAVLRGCHSQPRADNISIDEMIIPFSGHCGIRQYCPGKPNPVGIKVFVLANPTGLVCDMVVYQGDSTFPELKAQGFSLGECAILKLCETLVPGHYIYFDRYFTSIKLADTLLEKGFHGTGTIQRNRIPKECGFSPEKDLKKKSRGTSETLCRADGKIAITRWLDNKPVMIASTYYAASSADHCKRWSKRNKRYEIVSRPEVIKKYNDFMGGVDLADRMLSVCPARARTRKWTLRFVTHMVDLAVCNAWFEFRDQEKQRNTPTAKIPQLRAFRLTLGELMISQNVLSSDSESCSDVEDLAPRHKKRKVEIQPVPAESCRYHKADHLIAYSDKQNRCRKQNCKMITTAYCIKCNIFLCSTKKRNCFLEFHTP